MNNSTRMRDLLRSLGDALLGSKAAVTRLVHQPRLGCGILTPVSGREPRLPRSMYRRMRVGVGCSNCVHHRVGRMRRFGGLRRGGLPRSVSCRSMKDLHVRTHRGLRTCEPISVNRTSHVSNMSPTSVSILLMCLRDESKRGRKWCGRWRWGARGGEKDYVCGLRVLRGNYRRLKVALDSARGGRFVQFCRCLMRGGGIVGLANVARFSRILIGRFLSDLYYIGTMSVNGVGAIVSVKANTKFPNIPLGVTFPRIRTYLLSSLGGEMEFLRRAFTLLNLRKVSTVRKETRRCTGGGTCERGCSLYMSETMSKLTALSRCYLPCMGIKKLFISCGSNSMGRRTRTTRGTMGVLNKGVESVRCFSLPNSRVNHSLIVVRGMGGAPNGCPEGTKAPLERPLTWSASYQAGTGSIQRRVFLSKDFAGLSRVCPAFVAGCFCAVVQ